MQSALEMIEEYRTKYPDLTPDEEAAIRRHAENPSSIIFFRCKIETDQHSLQIGTDNETAGLKAENQRLRLALTALLPGYEQFIEWAVERRVLFLSEARATLGEAKAALEPVNQQYIDAV